MSSTGQHFITDDNENDPTLPSVSERTLTVSEKDENSVSNERTQAFPVNLKEVFELTGGDMNATHLRLNERRESQESFLLLMDKPNQNAESNTILENCNSMSNQSPILWKNCENKLCDDSVSQQRRWNETEKDNDNSDLHTVMNLSMGGERIVYQQSSTTCSLDRRRSWPQMADECLLEVQKPDGRIFGQVINDVHLNEFMPISQTPKTHTQEKAWNFVSSERDMSGTHLLPVIKPDKKDASCQVDDETLVSKTGLPCQDHPIALTKNGIPQTLPPMLDHNANTPGSNSGIKPEMYTEERYLVVEPRSKKVKEQRKPVSAFSCNHCSKVFSDSRSLHRHIQVHLGARAYSCPVCDKGFMLKGDLTRHIRIHSGEKPYECDVCSRRFTLKGNLMQHFRTHVPEKQYACTICSKNYAQKDSLHRHIRAHFGDKPFECMMCNKRFTLKADLSRHILIHSGIKAHTCHYCGRMFALKGNLTQHLRTHIKSNHKSDFKSVSTSGGDAEVDQLELPSVPILSNSENIASSYVPTSTTQVQSSGLSFCSECSRTFPSPESLQEHVQTTHEQSTHVPKGPYSCQICQKEFSLKGDLTRHLNSHNGVKPYQCDQCDKMFTLKSNLRQHQTTHVSDKNYPCPLCSKLFGNRRNLSLHLRRHQQASANFTCTRCRRSFLAKSDHFFHNCAKDKNTPVEEPTDNQKTNEFSHLNQHNEGLLPAPMVNESNDFEVKREILQPACNVLIANPESLPNGESFLTPTLTVYRHLYFATSHQSIHPSLKGFLHSQTEDGNILQQKIIKES